MFEILFIVGDIAVSTGVALSAFAGLVLLLLVVIAVVLARGSRRSEAATMAQAIRADELEERLADMLHAQAEASGRMQAMGEALAGRQSDMARAMNERLDAVTQRVGQSMEQSTRNTMDSLRHLHERLAVIDNAHKNLTDLTTQVTTLRDVLANKQARGAFGQARMEAIVQDGLPKGAYEFQFTLSNNKRPDCVVFLPDQRPLCIDAKFPLEAVTALRDARSAEEKKSATQRVRQDMLRHVSDIAQKYLISGETQEMALLFVPSESVYAEIHDGFDDVVQKAYRARVVLVSPSLLMLAIQVMQQILKDARMREAADQIRTEVVSMTDDLSRLRERVLKLQQHFGQANEDVRQILISADKIDKRASRIEDLDFDKAVTDGTASARPELFTAPIRKLQAGQ
ncbi:DNA recombination protein RmuC [Bradyrhizobium sp. LHD-71]|uniref:DNA recombination protein RmuC n=1 Tax=Bradyrhizobium sp. LHD-71 TaxID=3072141 RepID=UPI00280FC29E|nr:DNA recombination protein RmuC [Bradyrhizobium sp. LHD-71]MDQ8727263.1 DNA recombination protein RmuC [Bradyrhizobium sp. LHD-71]